MCSGSARILLSTKVPLARALLIAMLLGEAGRRWAACVGADTCVDRCFRVVALTSRGVPYVCGTWADAAAMAAQELRGLAFDAGARSLKSVAMKVSKARRRSRSVGGWLYREGIWAAASERANRERAERRVTFFLKSHCHFSYKTHYF